MKLVVQDACILIDLIEGSILELWPRLGFETITTDLVGMLRKKAEQDRIQVRGVLWVLDSLVEAGIITYKNAASKLKRILDAGSRLPPDECSKRLDAWK